MTAPRPRAWIDSSVISLTVAMAAELRSPDQERVVEMARRLVAALDRQGTPIEKLVARSIHMAARLGATTSLIAPPSPLNRRNWRLWVQFIRQTYPTRLTAFEAEKLPDFVRQTGISDPQGGVIWRTLKRLRPAGCGKWGQPSTSK